MLTLYHGWRSSASRRVRLCLAEKGLAFESKTIDLTKMEHHSPAFLKLNPNGVIPLLVLEDGMRRAFGPRDQVLKEMVKNHTEIVRSAGPGGVS